MYEYRCVIKRVVDGDTVDVDLDLGFGLWLRDERVRIFGIDTPESRTRDDVEKVFGLAAKQFVEELLPEGSRAILLSKEYKGKFGRILGDFKIGDILLTQLMLLEHHAVEYNGQSKDDIEAAHLENRRLLLESGKVTLK